jgi:hypothetical protein
MKGKGERGGGGGEGEEKTSYHRIENRSRFFLFLKED